MIFLPYIGVCVAEDTSLVVAGKESKDSLLSSLTVWNVNYILD